MSSSAHTGEAGSQAVLNALLTAMNEQDVPRAAALFTTDVVWHDVVWHDVVEAEVLRGVEAVRAGLERYVTAFPERPLSFPQPTRSKPCLLVITSWSQPC